LSKFSGSEFNTDLEVAVIEFMNSLPLVTELILTRYLTSSSMNFMILSINMR